MVKKGSNETIQVTESFTGNLYCPRSISKEALDQLNQQNIRHKIEIILKSNFPSLIAIRGFSLTGFKGSSQPIVLTENLSKGCLYDLIKCGHNTRSNQGWNNTKKLINLYGIASAMQFLHSLGFSHNDLKSQNILLDDHFYPKISNLGFIELNNNHYTISKHDHIKSDPNFNDIYAFGSIVNELFASNSSNHSIPKSYGALIERCLSKDPKKRPTFDTIVSELKNNKGFLENGVDIKEFKRYVRLFDKYTQVLIDNKSLLQNQEQITLSSNSIDKEKLVKCRTEKEQIAMELDQASIENEKQKKAKYQPLLQPFSAAETFSDATSQSRAILGNESFSECSTENELMSVASEKRVPEDASAITTITTFSDSQSHNQKDVYLSECSTDKELMSVASEKRVPENASAITAITIFSETQSQNQKVIDEEFLSECSDAEDRLMYVRDKKTPENMSTIDTLCETNHDCESHVQMALHPSSECSDEGELMGLEPKKPEPMLPSATNLAHDDDFADCSTQIQELAPSSMPSLGEEFFSECVSEREAPEIVPEEEEVVEEEIVEEEIVEPEEEIIEPPPPPPPQKKEEPPPPPKEVVEPVPEVQNSKCCLLL